MTTRSDRRPHIGGRASSQDCPRAGYVMLTYDEDYDPLVVETRCKTWGCRSCRDKVLAAVKRRMEYGCSMIGSSWLITLTYRSGPDILVPDADTVAGDQRLLFRFLKVRNPNLTWFKVVELTARGIPHLHLIVGGLIGTKGRCGSPRTSNWVDQECNIGCIQHEWGKAWQAITGSYVVGVSAVLGDRGAAAYLAKYLAKSHYLREPYEALGFKRRWSCSRNWPRANVQLRGSAEELWKKVLVVPKGGRIGVYLETRMEASKGHALLDEVGPEEIMKVVRRAKLSGLRKAAEKQHA